MATNQQFCLRWNNHQSTLISVFDTLLESGSLVDCTLAAEGQSLKAHKVVLSACSPYLESLLSQHYEKHPILILKDVTFTELKAMLDYMYRGEVNICQDQLGQFLKAAESLQIKGLTDNSSPIMDNGPPRKTDTPPRKLVNPYSKSGPLFPTNLVVEPRPKVNNNNNNSTTTNNNECGVVVPAAKAGSDGGGSPRRKRRRRSLDEDGMYGGGGDAECPAGVGNASVKSEPKFEEGLNNDGINSGDELPCDADDEEELDLSRPGTSQLTHNNLQPGWNASGENASDDMFTPGQHDPEQKVVTRPLVPSLKAMNTYMNQFNTSLTLSSGGWVGISGNLHSSLVSAAAQMPTGPHVQSAVAAHAQSTAAPPRNPIECPDCGKTYSSQHTLRRHMRLECGKEPQFHCPYCPRKTKQRYNLMLHIARAHKPPVDQALPSK